MVIVQFFGKTPDKPPPKQHTKLDTRAVVSLLGVRRTWLVLSLWSTGIQPLNQWTVMTKRRRVAPKRTYRPGGPLDRSSRETTGRLKRVRLGLLLKDYFGALCFGVCVPYRDPFASVGELTFCERASFVLWSPNYLENCIPYSVTLEECRVKRFFLGGKVLGQKIK